MSEARTPPTVQATPVAEQPSSIFSQRSVRQLGLFFGGASFFAISSVITRRSLIRRYKATIPKFYQQSNRPNANVNGAMEAFEALNIATINVLSVGMMLSGGILWALDISSLDDMRGKVRKNLGADGNGGEEELEEEIEEWLASVLARKEFKESVKKIVRKGAEETKDDEDGR